VPVHGNAEQGSQCGVVGKFDFGGLFWMLAAVLLAAEATLSINRPVVLPHFESVVGASPFLEDGPTYFDCLLIG
jgi:hypothetical protein